MRGARVVVGLAAVASVSACSMPFMEQVPVVVTVTPGPVATPDSASTPGPSATASPTKEALAMPFVSGSRNWTDVAKRVSPAVVRIEVAGCDTRVVGSGYFIAKDLIVTAGHVVSGASALSVQYAGGVVPALVVGIDRTSDVAMIRTAQPVASATLRLASQPAMVPTTNPTTNPTTATSVEPASAPGVKATSTPTPVGARVVGILGYPSGTFNLHATEGDIVGTETVDYGTSKVENALETDASITDGITGGPAVDRAGLVVGTVTGSPLWISGLDQSVAEKQAKGKALNRSQATTGRSRSSAVDRSRMRSTGFVVPAKAVADAVNRWRDSPNRDLLACYGDVAPVIDDPFALSVDVLSGHSYARDVAAALALHGQAINAGTYEVAYEMFTPRLQKELESLDAWRTKEASTHWVHAEVRNLIGTGNVVEAKVALRTTRSAAVDKAGQTCSISEQSYTLRTSGGGWLIDRVRTLAPPTAC